MRVEAKQERPRLDRQQDRPGAREEGERERAGAMRAREAHARNN